MKLDELGLVFAIGLLFCGAISFWLYVMNKFINIWLEEKDDFKKCRPMKKEKGVFDAHRISCAFLAAMLVDLVAILIKISLLVLDLNRHIIELMDMVLMSFQLISFVGVWAYLTYQSHLMEVRENARFLVLDTLFHNHLHTFRFNGKNLQGAMQDLLKEEMITPYGSSFSNTGIVYQLTQKGRNAYQEYLEVEAQKEALILPTSQVISTK